MTGEQTETSEPNLLVRLDEALRKDSRIYLRAYRPLVSIGAFGGKNDIPANSHEATFMYFMAPKHGSFNPDKLNSLLDDLTANFGNPHHSVPAGVTDHMKDFKYGVKAFKIGKIGKGRFNHEPTVFSEDTLDGIAKTLAWGGGRSISSNLSGSNETFDVYGDVYTFMCPTKEIVDMTVDQIPYEKNSVRWSMSLNSLAPPMIKEFKQPKIIRAVRNLVGGRR